MTNLITLFLLSLLPLRSMASAVVVSTADQAIADASYAVGLVGGVLLGVYALLGAFRTLREALGFSGLDSADLAPPPWASESEAVFAEGNRSDYLSNLAQRLHAEHEAFGIDWRDESGKSNIDYMREAGLGGVQIDRAEHSGAELAAYDKGLESRSLTVEREEIFIAPYDPSLEARREVFEDGRLSSWDVDGRYIGPPPDSPLGVVELPVFEFDDSAVASPSSPAVDYGSAFDDLRQQEAEVDAWARSVAQQAGADMALYDKFIAEDDVSYEEATRWAVEAASGEIRMPSPSYLSDPVEVAAHAAVSSHEWRTDDQGKFREHVIAVNGVDRSVRIDYDDDLDDAREEARFNASRDDGFSNADLVSMKELRKDQEFA